MKKGNLEDMLMSKKPNSGEMSKEEVQAKMDVLQELMDMCKAKMGDSVKNGMDEMQKVSVMAPNKEALSEGLDAAKEITDSPLMENLEEKAEEADEMPEDKNHVSSFLDDEDEDSIFSKKMKK